MCGSLPPVSPVEREAIVPQYELTQWPGRRPSTYLKVQSCTGSQPAANRCRRTADGIAQNFPTGISPACTTSVATVLGGNAPVFRVSSGLPGGFRRAIHLPSVSWLCALRINCLLLDYIGTVVYTFPQHHPGRCGEAVEKPRGATGISNIYRRYGLEPKMPCIPYACCGLYHYTKHLPMLSHIYTTSVS